MYVLFQFTVADLRPLTWRQDKFILSKFKKYRNDFAPTSNTQYSIDNIRNMGRILARESNEDERMDDRILQTKAKQFIKLGGFEYFIKHGFEHSIKWGFVKHSIKLRTEKNTNITIQLYNQSCYRTFTTQSLGVINRLALGFEFEIKDHAFETPDQGTPKLLFELLKTLLAYKIRVKNLHSESASQYDDCKIGELTEYLRFAISHSFTQKPKNKKRLLKKNLDHIIPLQPSIIVILKTDKEKEYSLPINVMNKGRMFVEKNGADIYKYILEKNYHRLDYNFCDHKIISNKNYTPTTTVFFVKINDPYKNKDASKSLSKTIKISLNRLQAEKDCLECILKNQNKLEKDKIQKYLQNKSTYLNQEGINNSENFNILKEAVFNESERKNMLQEVKKIITTIPSDSIFNILE